MKKSIRCVLAVAVAGPALMAQTVQEIVNGVVYARGGANKIASIQTERFTGLLATQTASGTFVLELKRPDKVRMQIAIGDQTIIKGFDGTTAWRVDGSNPAAKPVKMDTAEAEAFTHAQDIDGLLVGYAEKGITVDIVDKEMLGSSLVWKLKVTLKSGDTNYCYVETSGSQLLLKESGPSAGKEKAPVLKQYFRDFRRIKDLTFPFVITSVADDNTDSTVTLTVNDLILNDPIADDRFDMKTATADSVKVKPGA